MTAAPSAIRLYSCPVWRSTSPRGRRPVRWLVVASVLVVVFALVVVAAVTHVLDRPRPNHSNSSSAPSATDPVGRTSAVAVDGSVKARIRAAKLNADQRGGLTDTWPDELSLAVGEPVEIDADTIPDAGIVVTRRYIKPLPDQVTATLAFYDPELPGWRAAASQVAADRMSVSATVHHLSVWDDVVGGLSDVAQQTEGWAAEGGTWLYTQVGKAFSTRVDQPRCKGSDPTNPDWVLGVTTIEDAPENPLRYCSGRDDDDLVVKAVVNRGFGFVAHPAKPYTDMANSSYDEQEFKKALRTAVHVDDQFGAAVESLLGGKDLVGAGETLTLTYDEADARAGDPTLVRMDAPGTAQFIFSVVARLTGTILGSKTDGWVSSGLAIAQCTTDLQNAADGPRRVKAAVSCASGMDSDVARQIVNYQNARFDELTKAGKHPEVVDGAKIGGLVGRISIWLTLIGPVLDGGDFIAAKNFAKEVRTVTLATKPPNVTPKTLRSAEVPKACTMPQQRLRDNSTTRTGDSPGATGSLSLSDPAPVFADVARRGYEQAVSSYICNAGGVGWPPVVVLTGQSGKLLGSVDLGDLTNRSYGDRGFIHDLKVDGRRVIVTWSSTAGCCIAFNDHSTVLAWKGSGLDVESEKITRWAGDGVADDILAAALANDRSRLLDQDVVDGDTWARLVKVLRGNDSATASAGTDRDSQSRPHSYEVLIDSSSGDLLTWIVTMTPSKNRYGWRMVSAQPE